MVLEIKNLHVSVEGKEILRGINLKIDMGQIHAIMGPNGGGKSSLAMALMGHPNYKIESGDILFEGKSILQMKTYERAKLGLFLAFQYPYAVPGVSVFNFLRTAYTSLKFNGGPKTNKEEFVNILEFSKFLSQQMKMLEMDDAFALISGKEKLPYSRVSLTSSSKQLSIERPVSTEAAKKLFGKTEAYYQPKIAAKGKFLEGVIGYEAAFADGWQNGESIQTGLTVFKASPFYVARVELSPPGWTEPKKSDANLGKGKHLVLGLDYAAQTGIEYKENNYKEDRALAGIDLSGHYEGLTFQLEYNAWNVKFTDPSKKEQTPNGWYAQAGYFIDGPMIEPVIRYEVYDQDSNSSNKKETDTTIGVNWYLKGHSLKWGLNWVHSEYEKSNSNWLANSDKKDVYQLQAQIYF